VGRKSGDVVTFGCEWNLMIAGSEIDLREDSCSIEVMDEVIHYRTRVTGIVLIHLKVQVTGILLIFKCFKVKVTGIALVHLKMFQVKVCK